jgi:hypothetical protein
MKVLLGVTTTITTNNNNRGASKFDLGSPCKYLHLACTYRVLPYPQLPAKLSPAGTLAATDTVGLGAFKPPVLPAASSTACMGL